MIDNSAIGWIVVDRVDDFLWMSCGVHDTTVLNNYAKSCVYVYVYVCIYIYNIHTHMWSTDSSLLMTQTLPRTWGVHKKGVPQLLAKNDAGPRPGPSREDRNLQGLMSGWIFKTQIFQSVYIWVCLKIGYIPNYSHLIGIMIINHWV